jgi:hypothetical protein
MNPLYAELRWLPRAPQEFSERLKALRNSIATSVDDADPKRSPMAVVSLGLAEAGEKPVA